MTDPIIPESYPNKKDPMALDFVSFDHFHACIASRENRCNVIDWCRLGMQDSIVSRRGCKHGVGGVEETELKEVWVCDLCFS